MEVFFDHQLLSRHRFCLLEASMLELLPLELPSDALVPASLSSSAHLMPRLMDLNAIQEQARSTLLMSLFKAQQRAEQPAITMFIQTSVNSEALTRHWNRFQLAAPAPKRAVWLRLHDPRVMHQLLRMLTPAQRKRLFGPVESFTYWLGDGWVRADVNGVGEPADGDSGSTASWDWPRVEQIGLVNRALEGAGIVRAAEITARAQLAEQLIARARKNYALSEQGDLVEFAVRGLTTSLHFDDHPELRRAIEAGTGPDDDATLADRFALIDDAIWAAVAGNRSGS